MMKFRDILNGAMQEQSSVDKPDDVCRNQEEEDVDASSRATSDTL
jgi:hypothetical protein